MANSKDDQGHKDKNLDTSRKFLSQEMLMCNMKALKFYYLEFYNSEVKTNVNLKTKIDQMPRSKGLVPTERSYHN